MTHERPLAQKPSGSDDRMSITSLLCDLETSENQYPLPCPKNLSKSADNAHPSVSTTSKSKSNSIYIPSTSSSVKDHRDMLVLKPPAVSGSGCRQTRTLGCVNKSNGKAHKREHRAEYTEEESCFVWYMRECRAKNWKDVFDSFNRQFPDRKRHGLQGVQCMYYRFKKKRSLPCLPKQRGSDREKPFDENLVNRKYLDKTISCINPPYSWMEEAPRNGLNPSEDAESSKTMQWS